MYYSKKIIDVEIADDEYTFDVKVLPPSVCPYCNVGVKFDPKCGHQSKNIFIIFECPNCNKLTAVEYEEDNEIPLAIYPTQNILSTPIPEKIVEVSPKFKEIYLQAQLAENNNLEDLSAITYRRALEFLVKDYCIHLLPEQKSKIENEKLIESIKRLNEINPIIKKIADKIRIIGNDYTHYTTKLDYTPATMKEYIGIFVAFINGNLLSESNL